MSFHLFIKGKRTNKKINISVSFQNLFSIILTYSLRKIGNSFYLNKGKIIAICRQITNIHFLKLYASTYLKRFYTQKM